MVGRLTRTTAVAAVAAIALATGCSAPPAPTGTSPATPTATDTAAHGSSVSWARAYPTLASLTEEADLVVRGTVSREHHLVVENGMASTDTAVTVSARLKGGSAPTVVVRQAGGVVDGVLLHSEDAPLLHPGDEEILFLRRAGRSGADDVYVTLSGPSGRLRVENSRVRTLPGTSLTETLPSTVDAVENGVRAAVQPSTGATVVGRDD